MAKQPIIFKDFYNKDRELPEPLWGNKVEEADVQCPTCGSTSMCYSAHPDNPEEIFPNTVRCMDCGRITDYYEAYKQKQNHPTDTPREVIKPVEVPPAPTVYCLKDGKKVPIWYCLGSLTQGREPCPYLVRAAVHGAQSAEVVCKWGE